MIEVGAVSPGDQEWSGLTSNIVQTGEARLVAARTAGVTGDTVLAVLDIKAVGVTGEFTDVQLVLQNSVDSDLTEIPSVTCCGAVTIQ